MRGSAARAWIAIALCAFACALPLAGCGGGDDDSGEANTVASPGGSAGHREAGNTQGSRDGGSASRGSSEPATGAGSQSGSAIAPTPDASEPGGQPSTQTSRHPKKPHKPQSGGGQSSGGPTAGLSVQEAATYEAARALCANRDSLQYAPAEIRDDAAALAEFAERFAPQGEEQVVHDGCLAGLKSIGID